VSARRRAATAALGAAVVAVLGAAPRAARADGAFPDSEQVLLPAGRPDEIVLATNFGLIFSADGGASWEWTCETPLTANGRLYQLGVPPSAGGPAAARILATSLWGAVYSDDGACRWDGAGGELAEATVTDVFVDRGDARRVFALGADSAGQEAVYLSLDGGVTFGAPLFRAPSGGHLWGVESAAGDPATIYLALEADPDHPLLARTGDGGAHWDTVDLGAALGAGRAGLVAVDPTAPGTLFLRLSTAADDRLVISRDGGAHWMAPVVLAGALTSFLRRADGTLLVAGITSDGRAFGARSFDGGASFAAWPDLPHLRGLAERAGLLYAAADNRADGFALGVSSDGGDHWRPLLAYDQVARIRPCVAEACRADCRRQATSGLWPAAMCEEAGASVDAGADASDGGAGTMAAGGGCGCQAGGGASTGEELLLLLVVVGWGRMRRLVRIALRS